MPVAWYICPYKRRANTFRPTRYCAMDDFTAQIKADGGSWAESEVLGNVAVVKVRASAETLTEINAATGFVRLPKDLLDDPLSSLTTAQKNAIKNKLQSMGYSAAELSDRFPNDIGTYTLRDVLVFSAKRRLRPRYDSNSDTIICDGIEQPTRSIANVDEAVQ
jgi:hypothetical protein